MTWNSYRRRGETLHDVIALVDERRDGVLPTQVPGVTENFADDLDLLGALLLKWHARLSGNIERALGQQPVDLSAAVVSAWRTTAEQMPGVRLVVDRAAEHGDAETQHAMARARHREWSRLAMAAGLASTPGAAAAAVGRGLEERARSGLAPLTEPAPRPAAREAADEAGPEPTTTFVDRIRAALAAA